ncbi:MAG TPA: hypothetical protein VF950_11860 [Planctomycetota bacterium]
MTPREDARIPQAFAALASLPCLGAAAVLAANFNSCLYFLDKSETVALIAVPAAVGLLLLAFARDRKP